MKMIDDVKLERLWSVKKQSNRLKDILLELDNFYFPTISDCVQIDDYSNKLLTNAVVNIVVSDKNDIGVFAVYTNDKLNKIAYISTIGILPTYQKKGLGIYMMKQIEKICTKKGMRELRLDVGKDNKKTIRFYENYGFIIINTECADRRFFTMEKSLHE
jgi:ribosomal protein S18 acetylase RimI-like enzyme